MDRIQAHKLLVAYFTEGLDDYPFGQTVGSEIETQFVYDCNSRPINLDTSQAVLRQLAEHGWQVTGTRGDSVTEVSQGGNRILYELGSSNLELVGAAVPPRELISRLKGSLAQLYLAAQVVGCRPLFEPIVEVARPEDLLVIPDERDAAFGELDGRSSLALLTQCSAVQFVVDVPPAQAIEMLNRLGARLDKFLAFYPQDSLWRRYIQESRAGYGTSRYGGPVIFRDLDDYCQQLLVHQPILNGRMASFDDVAELTFDQITLFLRSIWWYFRLRRYGRKLCIEVRPLARQSDHDLRDQFLFVLEAMGQAA